MRLFFAYALLGAVTFGVASVAVACADDGTPIADNGTSSGTTAPTTTSTREPEPEDDSGSPKDSGSDTGGQVQPDASNPTNTLSIADSGGMRFPSPHPFTDYTCPMEPGFGRTISWELPGNIAAAIGIPGGGPFKLRVTSGNSKNVTIVGPAPGSTVYFEGTVSVALLASGTLPVVTLAAKAPASGAVIVQGKYTCP